MTPPPSQWAIPLGVSLGAPIGLYITFLLLGGFPLFQKHFFYAHRLNTLFWHNLDEPEYWGFARNQVTPFTLPSGNESLYAWHILPLRSILEHQDRLQAAPAGFSDDVTASESFKILKEDPTAQLVISFHGNAGHIAQGLRTEHFHTLTDMSNFHVLSIDYRGYGKSTGSPSEAGLIQDGIATVEWAISVAGVASERIVVVGHSLGTAVTSGVVEHFAVKGVEFAGVILIAGFSNVPTLLSSYSGAGFIPVLSPLRPIPPLLRFFQGFIVDKWDSASRLAEIVHSTKRRLRLTLIHAKNDMEIPCYVCELLIQEYGDRGLHNLEESDALFKSAAIATMNQTLDDEAFLAWKRQRSTQFEDDTFISVVTAEPDIIVRQELVLYGGHNKALLSSAVPLAVMRSFLSDLKTSI